METKEKGNENGDNTIPLKFKEALREAGIIGVYSNQNSPIKRIHEKLDELIKEKKLKRIKILVYYGYKLLFELKEKIIDAMDANAKISIIIAEDPSDFMNEVWELQRDAKETRNDCINEKDMAMEIIERLKEIAKDKGKYFKVKKYKTQARYAMIMINNEWAWWTPYHPGLIVKDTTSFILEKGGEKTILEQCYKHFKLLWDRLPDNIAN